MPAAKRFAFLGDTVRNHPLIVASTAATAGVLLGGFVAVQLLGTPPQSRVDSAPASQAVVETKTTPKPVAETTGSAPPGDSMASAECEQQTWPHLSRVCMEEYRSKQRTTRVISTDKPTISAIEASPTAAIEAKPAITTPAVAAIAPPAASPLAAAREPAPAAKPAPAVTTIVAAPETRPAALSTAAQDAQAPSQAGAKVEAKKEKRDAKKSQRKPKPDIKTPVRPDSDDDYETAVASAAADERNDGRIANGRADRSRRIVERWTERDYDVPDASGRGQRRVTVIRRSSGGGLFESLFGN